jgi:hypothetical protein
LLVAVEEQAILVVAVVQVEYLRQPHNLFLAVQVTLVLLAAAAQAGLHQLMELKE